MKDKTTSGKVYVMLTAILHKEKTMTRYEYVEKPSSGRWWMEVLKGTACKGNIRKNPVTGRYQFYRGAANVLRPSFEEADLETLIALIEELDL
jgi:hypothetical protein